MTIRDIEQKIAKLPRKKLVAFRAWFFKFDGQAWDKQFKEDAQAGKLDALATGPDRLHPGHHEIYLYCPDGYGRTKLSNVAIEKALSVRATTRNWKTACTLSEMASKL